VNYSIIRGHDRCGNPKRKGVLTDVLVSNIGHLDVRPTNPLEDSSIPLLPDVPDDVKQPAAAGALGLFVGPGQQEKKNRYWARRAMVQFETGPIHNLVV
jgi:hypothetical protein